MGCSFGWLSILSGSCSRFVSSLLVTRVLWRTMEKRKEEGSRGGKILGSESAPKREAELAPGSVSVRGREGELGI